MDCPRCHEAMVKRMAAPRPGARVITADMCDKCHAMFFENDELADVSVALAKVPFDAANLREGPSDNARLDRCPACHAEGDAGPREVAVLDVKLDFCRGCHGVYFDGGEYEALARAVRLDASKQEVGSYRVAPQAARALRADEFECSRCKDRAPLSESMILPAGLVCARCYYATEEQRLKSYQAPKEVRDQILRDRFAGPDLDPSQNSGGGGGFGLLLGVVAALAQAGPQYCEHCGRPRNSVLCTHY